MWWFLGLQLLAAYALGSLSGSLLLGRLRGVDIRQYGSGNAGGTNALRAQGWRFALGVVAIDVGKGVAASALVPLAGGPGTAPLWCGLAAVAGHVWPLWHGFRGGKGGATALGVVAVVLPWALVPMLAVWVLTVGLSGYVSLATVLAALVVVPAAWVLAPDAAPGPYLAFAAALVALILFAHRSNLARLARGGEARFERARFLRGARRP